MNKQLPPFFIITGSCVRSQTFTPKYNSTETWVRYSDFVDYFPVALDECAEDKVALAEENARLKSEIQRDVEIHRRNTAMWKDDCEYHHAENARLKAEVKELKNQPDPLTAYLYAAELAKDKMKTLKAEVERLRKAGDELLHEWSSGDETDGRNFKKCLVLWNAAKEGKPSV